MRAIIIEDKDAQALLRDLELHRLRSENVHNEYKEKPPAWTEEQWRKDYIDRLHRSFHFVVCRWLQDHGCNVIRS